MAIAQINNASGNFHLELAGNGAGYLQEFEVGAIKSDEVATGVASDFGIVKTLGSVSFGACSAKVGLTDSGPMMEWISSIWNKNLIEQSGALVIADINFKERRRCTFTNAHITECKFDDFNSNDAKKSYGLSFKFQPEMLTYEKTSGAQLKADVKTGDKGQKRFNGANYEAVVDGLPSKRILKVSGISATAETAFEYVGAQRYSTVHTAAVKFGDVTVELSADDETFDAWNKYAKSTMYDGNAADGNEKNITVNWLDPTLKKTLGTITLGGCTMKEFKLNKFENNKNTMQTCTAIFMVETIKLALDKVY